MMKAGDIHFRQDGNMVATLWKDKRPVAILSTNAQPQMGEAERKAPGGKKKVAGPKPILVYTTLTTLLESHLYGGGNTLVGGCRRRPWSTPSSSGAKATSLLQPRRGVSE